MSKEFIFQMADDILKHEGGYVDDPDDPGGATNFGVTLGTLRHLRKDLTQDGRIDRRDLRAMTPKLARDIYVQDYFDTPNINLLPAALWPCVFDMQVNSGRNAILILQRLFNKMGYSLKVDGRIGPKTAHCAQAACDVHTPLCVDAYAIARRLYYISLAQKRPSLRKFARSRAGGKGGWIKRAESFMSKRFHWTDQEFQEVTQSWD